MGRHLHPGMPVQRQVPRRRSRELWRPGRLANVRRGRRILWIVAGLLQVGTGNDVSYFYTFL